MKPIKKILSVLGILSALALLLIILIPFLYKDELVEAVKEASNDELVNARLDFSDASLSLLKHFPKLMVRLDDVHIVGENSFEGHTLLEADHVEVDFDVMSIIKKSEIPTLRSISIDGADLNLLTLADGSRNFDVVPPSTAVEETETEQLQLDINDITIANSSFTYDDQSSRVLMKSKGIDLEGTATLRGENYVIDYDGDIEQSTLRSSGINYLSKAKAVVKGAVDLDLEQSKYTLGQTDLQINDLDMAVDGWLQLTDAILMDFSFESRDDQFKKLWSLIPAAYTADYNNANIQGTMGIEGYVRGTYDSRKDQLPSFNLQLNAKDGQVSYPNMPKSITGINSDINISSPGSLDRLEIDIPQLRFEIDDRPFDGRLTVKNASSNPDINMQMRGGIDLSSIPQIIPLEGVQALAGIIEADAQVIAKYSDIEQRAYQNTLISGDASLANFELEYTDRPKITIAEMQSIFSPERLEFNDIRGKIGETNFKASAELDNVVALFVPGQKVEGALEWKADYLELNQWITTDDQDDEATTAFDASLIPENFQLDVKATTERILYLDYDMRNIATEGSMSNGDLTIKRMSSIIDDSDFSISGKLENLLGFLFMDDRLTGDIIFKSDFLNLNQFMDEAEEPVARTIANTDEALSPIVIPENIAVNIQTDIKNLIYDNLDVEDIDGIIRVLDGEAKMENVNAKALEGSFTMNGGYVYSMGSEESTFELEYTINSFDYTKTFDKVNTFRFLAPIGKFIKGNFNSTLKMSGKLGDDLMPKLNTINAEGAVETFNGLLSEFKPLEMINDYFNLDALSRMKLENTKNFFSVADGTVTINEFDQTVKDIALKISGTHTLEQDIDYVIKAKVPKEYLSKTGLVQLADKGLSTINTQINKLGLNIENGRFVNLNFLVTGSILQPKVQVKVVGMDGKTDITDAVKERINEAVETVKDSVKTTVNNKIDTLERQAEEKRDAIVDTLSAVATAKLDSVKADLKGKVDSLVLKEVGDVIPDTLRQKIDSLLIKGGNREVDKVKDILKDIGLFKKKKKKKKSIGGF